MNRRNVVFLVVTVLGVALDQLTKWWIVHNVVLGTGSIEVIPGFLDIVHAQNPGAAFGMLGDFAYRHYLFLVFTAIAGVVVLDLFRRLPPTDWFMATTLGLILSGAIGNAIDRARQQYVTDFLRVYTDHAGIAGWLRANFGTNEWPSFNVADAALVVGVGMYVVHHLFFEEDEEAEAKEQPAPAPPADDLEDADTDVGAKPAVDPAGRPTDPGAPA